MFHTSPFQDKDQISEVSKPLFRIGFWDFRLQLLDLDVLLHSTRST